MTSKFSLILLIATLGLSSCVTTYNMSSIQVELLKPAIFAMPDSIDTIAIFKRDFYQSDTARFSYFDVDKNKVISDTNIRYSDLSNKCTTALAEYLDSEGYFLKVINYNDSMNHFFSKADSLISYPELHKKIGADIFVFLDYFQLEDELTNNIDVYFKPFLVDLFPEFKKSSKIESVKANLLWTITFKGDSAFYLIRQPDNLHYGNSVTPELFGNDHKHLLLLQNISIYLGKDFASRIIPSWLEVERTYYKSNNVDMLKAEEHFLKGEWLKAAEIYNRETKNKNRNIAAKARYNMALVCEMEGKPDAAIDWLVLSYSAYKNKNPNMVHKSNCQQYINILALRKKEIARLDNQVREMSAVY